MSSDQAAQSSGALMLKKKCDRCGKAAWIWQGGWRRETQAEADQRRDGSLEGKFLGRLMAKRREMMRSPGLPEQKEPMRVYCPECSAKIAAQRKDAAWLASMVGLGAPPVEPRCDGCGKVLHKHEGGFGGATRQSEGVNCPHCGKRWCDTCHPSRRGTTCPQCGRALRPNFAANLMEW
jgi:DNA-directed RNA polymerase subunit RPC12/RpoP